MAQKTELVVATSQTDAGKLDPHQASAGADKGVLNWMFNALVRIKPGSVEPGIHRARSRRKLDPNADGTEWTFKIRDGVQCHRRLRRVHRRGRRLLAEARRRPRTRSAFAGDFASIDKVEAADKYTVKITLKNPIPSLLGLCRTTTAATWSARRRPRRLGDGFGKKPIGTGPFMFDEYQPQQFVKLAANKALFPRRAEARRRSSTATSRPMRRATSRSAPARST